MLKLIALMTTTLIGLGLPALLAGPEEGPGGPPPDAKKKGAPPGAVGDLRKAYDAIRRLRPGAGDGGSRGERLRDWAERAAAFYRKGVEAKKDDDERLAHEYGAMAHDLARATEHAAAADRPGRRGGDLPPPPGESPEDSRERAVRDLRAAYDHLRDVEDQDPPREARFYLDAARDLYRAARRDLQDDHLEQAGELARAAEAMSHVPEHMTHARRGPDAPPKRKGEEPRKKRPPAADDALPPPLD